MSGGHFDYFYSKMEQIADEIHPNTQYSKEEIIVSKLMRDFAKVMHELEWWQSGDSGKEVFLKEYNKFKSKWLKDSI